AEEGLAAEARGRQGDRLLRPRRRHRAADGAAHPRQRLRRQADGHEGAGGRRRRRRCRRGGGTGRRGARALPGRSDGGWRDADEARYRRSEPKPRRARLRRRPGRAARRRHRRWLGGGAARARPGGGAVRVRAGRRRAGGARHGQRLRPESLRLRAADRVVPGHQAQARRHVHEDRAGAGERPLRRVGDRLRRAGAAGRRGGGADLGDRRLLVRGEGEHPDPRRHGLHLGVGLPPVLSARPAARPQPRQRAALEGPPRLAAGNAERPQAGRLKPEDAMDFTDTKEEAEYRARVRDWLDRNAKKKGEAGAAAPKYGHDDLVPLAREWQAKKYEAGFAGITMPVEYGGQGGTQMQQVIYNQEEARYVVPRGVYESCLGMCIPTRLAYATEEQKQRYVRPALRGEEIWCQLFSEPAAGSDVAAVRTRAVRDGDDWIINGQKIWTSGAHFSDFGVIVLRTDPSVPKHKGLSYFFLDMRSPGIEVRRIKQIAGISNFNEVFFTDVRVPDSQRLGEVGGGWKVALTTLMNERYAVGHRPPPDFDEIFELARNLELEDGPAIRN